LNLYPLYDRCCPYYGWAKFLKKSFGAGVSAAEHYLTGVQFCKLVLVSSAAVVAFDSTAGDNWKMKKTNCSPFPKELQVHLENCKFLSRWKTLSYWTAKTPWQ